MEQSILGGSGNSQEGRVDGTSAPSLRMPADCFSASELRSLGAKIVESGALGRSQTYSKLLHFLIDASINKQTPRELDIALGALGKDDSFDVSSDSAVRVAIHQLRKKLSAFYLARPTEAVRGCLVIPKGRHSLFVDALMPDLAVSALSDSGAAPRKEAGVEQRLGRGWLVRWAAFSPRLLVLVSGLLIVNFLLGAFKLMAPSLSGSASRVSLAMQESQQAAKHPLWASVLSDEKPLLLVMGDYYIFGELDARGGVARMVREFGVNSRADLEEFRFNEFAQSANYRDLDLSYMPEGSAFALAKIAPLLVQSGKTFTMKMMSDLTTADIRSNHVVYIGYISALDRLANLAFAGSGLAVGRSYDELIDVGEARYFTSDAGLPAEGQPFRDYGFFSSFSASHDSRVILVAGMRDAGLMHTAQALSESASLVELQNAFDGQNELAEEGVENWAGEALYEVYGVDRMNFDARLVYRAQLETESVWRTAN